MKKYIIVLALGICLNGCDCDDSDETLQENQFIVDKIVMSNYGNNKAEYILKTKVISGWATTSLSFYVSLYDSMYKYKIGDTLYLAKFGWSK